MKTVITAVVVLSLAACTTQNKISAGISDVVGQPISYAISALGFPDKESKVGDLHAYTWTMDKDTPLFLFTGDNYGMTAYNVHESCKLDLMVDDTDIVVDFHWMGNKGACKHYAKWLKTE